MISRPFGLQAIQSDLFRRQVPTTAQRSSERGRGLEYHARHTPTAPLSVLGHHEQMGPRANGNSQPRPILLAIDAEGRLKPIVANMRSGPSPLTRPASAAVAAGYGLALAVFLLRTIGSDLPLPVELPGSIALAAVVAAPPTLAVLSTHRPVLLVAAGVAAISTLLGLSVLGLPMVVIGMTWIVSYRRVTVPATTGRALLVIGAAWTFTVAAFVVLFLHIDPSCSETLVDGTVRAVDADGFESGWLWEVGSTSSGSTTIDIDVASSSCSSDVVVVAEAAGSLALAGLAVGSAWRLAERSGYPPPG